MMLLRTGCLIASRLHQACFGHAGLQPAASAPWCLRPAAVAAVALTRCQATSQGANDASQPARRRRSKSAKLRSSTDSSPASSLLTGDGAANDASNSSTAGDSSASRGSNQAAGLFLYTIDECMQLVAAHSMFLATEGDSSAKTWASTRDQERQQRLQQKAVQALQQHNKPGDCWLFVHCGSWLDQPPGLGSAALAVLQVWHVEQGNGDYTLWELGSDCMPTGEPFFSLTGEAGTYGRSHLIKTLLCFQRGSEFRVEAWTHWQGSGVVTCERSCLQDQCGWPKKQQQCSVLK
jgi:hypothetical protein